MRPLIAVAGRNLRSGRVSGWREDALGAPAPYLHALRRAGAQEAVLLPTEDVGEDQARQIVERFDGLLLTGGGDVDPARYGQERHAEVAGISPSRDAFELALAKAGLDLGTPILGVCRGMQVLNVALGGTLHQHLEDLDHVHRGADQGWSAHPVRLEEGSRVAQAMGRTRVDCSASHHQAVDRLGTGLRAVGWADDRVVEAAEMDDGWVVAVQWHPERTADTDPAQQGLFEALAERARLRPAGRRA